MSYKLNIEDESTEQTEIEVTEPGMDSGAEVIEASDMEMLLADLVINDDDFDALYEPEAEDVKTERSQRVDDDILAALDDLVIGIPDAEIEPEPVAEVEVEASTVLDDAELSNLEFSITRAELYASQTAVSSDDPSAVEEKRLAGPSKKARKARSPRVAGPASVRVPRDLTTVADEWFVLEGDPTTMSANDLADFRAATMMRLPTQKKVAEKFENLFTSISVDKAPSRYVTIAFALLDRTGMMTSSDLIAAYRTVGAKNATEPYDEGTARSQCGQIMNLFDAVMIARRSGQALALNPHSRIGQQTPRDHR